MATVDELIVKVGADASSFQEGLSKATDQLKNFGESVTSLGKSLSLKLVVPLTGLGILAVKNFAEQESAMRQLESALRANGQNVEANMAKYVAFSQQIQRITTTADETVLKLVQMAQSMGVTGDNAMRAAQNAIGLASAFGLSAEGTIRMTAALEQGNTTLLKRYLPALRGIKDETKVVAEAQRLLGGMFGVAVAQAGTFTGQLAQLKNNFGDFLELIGGDIAEMLTPFITQLNQLSLSLQNMDAETRKTFVQFGLAVAAIGPALIALGGLTSIINTAIAAFGGLSLAALTASGGLLAVAMSPLGVLALAIAGAALQMDVFNVKITSVNRAINEAAGGAKLAWEDVQHIFASVAANVVDIWNGAMASLTRIVAGFTASLASMMNAIPGLSGVASALSAQAQSLTDVADKREALGSAVERENALHEANKQAIITSTEASIQATESKVQASAASAQLSTNLAGLATNYNAVAGSAGSAKSSTDSYTSSVNSLLSSVGGVKTELRNETDTLNQLQDALVKMPSRYDEISQAIDIQKQKVQELQNANAMGFQKMGDASNNWASTFTSALKSGENAFSAFAKSILDHLADMAFKAAESGLNQVFGGLFNGGGSGGGFLGGLFGGGGGSSSSSSDSGGGILSSIGDFFGGFFADGGVAPGNKMSIVGENGPEVLMPSSPTRVVPLDQMQLTRGGGGMGMGAGGGGIVQTINVNSSVDARGADASVDRRIREILYSEEPRLIKRAVTEAMSSVRTEVNRGGQFAKDMGRRR